MTPRAVEIPPPLLARAYEAARRAYPTECCGYLTGPPGGPAAAIHPCRNVQEAGLHPSAPERGADRAFTMAPEDLLAFDRAFDSGQPPLVLYHSHPNGRAYFSATDREVALGPFGDTPAYPVQHLVIGVREGRVTESALFAWDPEARDFVEVGREVLPRDDRPSGAKTLRERP